LGKRAAIKRYLRENWGAPFIVAFMALLIASAVYLSFGLSDEANTIAVYAYYSLVAGVVLQIASYVKYGEKAAEHPREEAPPSELRRPMTRGRKLAVLAVSAALVSGIAAAVYTYYPAISESLPHQTYPPLAASVSFSTAIAEPNGTRIVAFGVSASGGNMPYTFTALWSDNVTQTDTTGIFTRAFAPGASLPASAGVQVKSSDGQTVTVSVTITQTG